MADPNRGDGVAQACVHASAQSDVRTLAARLRAHLSGGWCELSTAELGALFATSARQIRRELGKIRHTYRGRFVEIGQSYGRSNVAVRRRIFPKKCPRVMAYSQISPGGVVAVSGVVDRRADLADAPPARAPRERRRPKRMTVRRRATRLDVPTPELMRAPVSIEPEVIAAVTAAHPVGVGAVLFELRRPQYHARREEACRALRTLAERETDLPLRLFRFLFADACRGGLQVDREADAERVRAAERSEWSAHDGPIDPESSDPPPPGQVELAHGLYIDRAWIDAHLRRESGPPPPLIDDDDLPPLLDNDDLTELGISIEPDDVPY